LATQSNGIGLQMPLGEIHQDEETITREIHFPCCRHRRTPFDTGSGPKARSCPKTRTLGERDRITLWAALRRPQRHHLVDEVVLAAEGVTDFSGYAVVPDAPLLPDLFL